MIFVLAPVPTTTPVANQSDPRTDVSQLQTPAHEGAPSRLAPSDEPLIVNIKAATGDSWVKYQVDDSKPTTLVLKQGQSRDLPPAKSQIALNYGNRLTLELKINNRDAYFPPDAPKYKSTVIISRDNVRAFFQ